jgi:thymidylate kinase
MNLDQLAAEYRTLALDGSDGVGKTTLAHQLAAQHGFSVHHSTRTPEGVSLIARYRRILAAPGLLVLDRCFISELVYGPRYHGRSRIALGQAIELAHAVAACDGALVHLTGSPVTIHSRLLARDGRAAANADEIEALVSAYERVFDAISQALPSRVIRLDTTNQQSGPD